MSKRHELTLGLLVIVALPSLAATQPIGPEFQVNTYTTSSQEHPSVATDDSGNFVVVWASVAQDGCAAEHVFGGCGTGVFGQRYDSSGNRLGTEFQVNSFTLDYQDHPSVASDGRGNFVVVWRTQRRSDDVFGQRYDSAGSAVGPEFHVNTYTTWTQSYPAIAVNPNGDVVVVWQSYTQDGSDDGIFGQRYDATGSPQGAEFQVNTYTTAGQGNASVACLGTGDFVVVWDSFTQDGSSFGVFGQRYDSAGNPLGAEFQVNSSTNGYQRGPDVTADASGNFIVVWTGQDGSNGGIFGQRFDSAGNPLGGEFQVNTYTTSFQIYPSTAADVNGNFTVVWSSLFDDVFGRRFDASGNPVGGEFQVNTYTTNSQYTHPQGAVSSDPVGNLVVVWQSYEQDGSDSGVFGQRFAGLPSLSISDVSVNEGNVSGSAIGTLALFAVSLSAPSTQTVTIDYAAADGTAMAPSDYREKLGTLSLSPGQTSGRIAVVVNEDNLHENDETFFVNLSNPINATIADAQGVGTILNDDP